MAFESSKQKILRARQHIDDLNNEISNYKNSRPYRLIAEANSDPAFIDIVIHCKQIIPAITLLILADAIHNLRSALDHLSCDLIKLGGYECTREIYFPICSNRQKLEIRLKKELKNIPAAAKELMLKLKPYKDENEALWGIHEIDIIDKHKSLMVVGQIFGEIQPSTIRRGGTITLIPDATNRMRILQPGEKLTSIDATPLIVPGDELAALFEVAFGDEPLVGEPIFPLLNQLAEYIENIIGVFEDSLTKNGQAEPPTPILLRRRVADLLRIT